MGCLSLVAEKRRRWSLSECDEVTQLARFEETEATAADNEVMEDGVWMEGLVNAEPTKINGSVSEGRNTRGGMHCLLINE